MRNTSDTTKDTTDNITVVDENATTARTPTVETLFSPPGTDLCMDWEEACSLGCLLDPNRYFLLIMD